MRIWFQSTRPTWGATRGWCRADRQFPVSIHAPHVGRDQHRQSVSSNSCRFNPRAPRGARRSASRRTRGAQCRFNPRAPRGARREHIVTTQWEALFQSTRPTWGATDEFGLDIAVSGVSIHAPHVGRDRGLFQVSPTRDVSIHAPHVGRDVTYRNLTQENDVSIHAPHVGRDFPSAPSA